MQHQGGLPGTVGAEQRHPFAGVDMQAHAEQSLVAVGVRVRQTADVEDGRRHERSKPSHVPGVRPV